MLKLVPVGLLVGILVLVLAADRAVVGIGDKLPGRITFKQPDLLVDGAYAGQLAELWATMPAANASPRSAVSSAGVSPSRCSTVGTW